jgi:hypothetical protein
MIVATPPPPAEEQLRPPEGAPQFNSLITSGLACMAEADVFNNDWDFVEGMSFNSMSRRWNYLAPY